VGVFDAADHVVCKATKYISIGSGYLLGKVVEITYTGFPALCRAAGRQDARAARALTMRVEVKRMLLNAEI